MDPRLFQDLLNSRTRTFDMRDLNQNRIDDRDEPGGSFYRPPIKDKPITKFPIAGEGRNFGPKKPITTSNRGSVTGPKLIVTDGLTGKALVQARRENQAKLAARDKKLSNVMKGF